MTQAENIIALNRNGVAAAIKKAILPLLHSFASPGSSAGNRTARGIGAYGASKPLKTGNGLIVRNDPGDPVNVISAGHLQYDCMRF